MSEINCDGLRLFITESQKPLFIIKSAKRDVVLLGLLLDNNIRPS